MENKRVPGLDIIRTIAIGFVIITHSITLSGVIDRNVGSPKLFLILFLRFAAMSCVPLFIMLTGYLASEKKLSARYFTGIIPVLASYFVISAACAVGKWVYFDVNTSVFEAVLSIFNFTADTYAWYVEMYIGLFLLIPFLNILWKAIPTSRGKVLLIVSLAFLTSLPSLFTSFIVNGHSLDIVPGYWEAFYPITYYFIGAYIREYKPSLRKKTAEEHEKSNSGIFKSTAARTVTGIAAICAAIFIPSFTCYMFSAKEYAWYVMNGFGCITTGIIALTIFIFFYDIKCPKPFAAVTKEISVCSFEMYLLSALADAFVYGKISLPLPLAALSVFALSYISARVLRLILVPIIKTCTRPRKSSVQS